MKFITTIAAIAVLSTAAIAEDKLNTMTEADIKKMATVSSQGAATSSLPPELLIAILTGLFFAVGIGGGGTAAATGT